MGFRGVYGFETQGLRLTLPAGVDARATADQRRLRAEMKASGRLVEEMYRRGYGRNPDRLIHRPDFVG